MPNTPIYICVFVPEPKMCDAIDAEQFWGVKENRRFYQIKSRSQALELILDYLVGQR